MTVSDPSSARLAALLSSVSVEISSRGHQVAELRDHFAAGTDVTITFLPGDNYRHNVETAAALRRAGYNPVPHIAAREMASREALDDFLARARGEADVTRIVLIAGDVAAAKGPVQIDMRCLRQRIDRGAWIASVSVAGHPEGHPFLELPDAIKVLRDWRDWGRRTGARVDVVTQFCFESAPILQWIAELDRAGIDLPVIVAKQSMAEFVAHLERHGYVERVPDPSDRRAKLVRATARGAEIYAIAREVVAELEDQWTRALGKAKMRQLRELLGELNAAL